MMGTKMPETCRDCSQQSTSGIDNKSYFVASCWYSLFTLHAQKISSLWADLQTQKIPNKMERSLSLHNAVYFQLDDQVFDAEVM